MYRLIVVIGAVLVLAFLVTSCDQQKAVDKLMQNQQLVENIMNKMWEDSTYKAKLLDKVMGDQQGYGHIIDATLGDSTMFSGLMSKIGASEGLKKQVMAMAEAWKKEAGRKK